MAKKLKGDQVFTGQLQSEGDVVFLTVDGEWKHDLQLAEVATSPNKLEELEVKAQKGVDDNLVVDIYPFVVTRDENGKITPAHIREKMRTRGPSIAYGYDQ